MALTASASRGYEFLGSDYGAPPKIVDIIAAPATAYQSGDLLVVAQDAAAAGTTGEGYATLYAEGDTLVNGYYICLEDKTTGANTATLEKIQAIKLRPGDRVRATIQGHLDTTVAATNDAKQWTLTADGAATADSELKGALFYVYSGTAQGQWGVISAYDVADGGHGLGAQLMDSLWTLGVAPVTGDGIIILIGAASNKSVVGISSGLPGGSERLLEVDFNDGTTAEIFKVCPDQNFAENLGNLMLDATYLGA